MQKSESIAALAGALAKAQADIQGAKKDSENPFFKSRYADLSAVWDACRGSLTKNGLAVIQTTDAEDENGSIPVETILVHESGEWVSGLLKVRPVKDDPQGMGSALTYARRYALSAMVGVAPEDDDGNAASHGNGASKPISRAKKPAASPVRTEWFATIKGAGNTLNAMGDTPEWTLSRANEFANDNFNTTGGVDGLTEAQLAEMAKLMSNRIDEIKSKKKSPKDAEKDNLILAVKSNMTDLEMAAYLTEKGYGPLESLSTEQLRKIDQDTGIPF